MNYDYDRNDTGRGFENKHIHFPCDVAVMQFIYLQVARHII